MCALPAPCHASIIKVRNKVIKERNKVSTASAYYLEQWHAWLIVECKNRQDCKRKQRQSDRKRKQRQSAVKES